MFSPWHRAADSDRGPATRCAATRRRIVDSRWTDPAWLRRMAVLARLRSDLRARPLGVWCQTAISDALAKEILAGTVVDGFQTVSVKFPGPRVLIVRPPELRRTAFVAAIPTVLRLPGRRTAFLTRRDLVSTSAAILLRVGVGAIDGDCNPRIVVDRHGVLPVKRSHLAHERRRQRAIGHR